MLAIGLARYLGHFLFKGLGNNRPFSGALFAAGSFFGRHRGTAANSEDSFVSERFSGRLGRKLT
jgi:hypothetical protein